MADWTADWEDVPDVRERRTPSPVLLTMDGATASAPSSPRPLVGFPPGLPMPPGLKAKPVIPFVQPFNMFEHQQVSYAAWPM